MSYAVELADADATEALGRALAANLPARAVLYLEGHLGAGKTTLARALLRGLGVTGAVRSPTYTLVERYSTSAGDVVHLDLYRIADPEELHFLGLDDLVAVTRLWLIEWPERGRGVLPRADLHLRLSVADGGRHAEFETSNTTGQAWLAAIST